MDPVGSTWYGFQIYSRDFTLATGRNDYLTPIGRKGRVPVYGRKPVKNVIFEPWKPYRKWLDNKIWL